MSPPAVLRSTSKRSVFTFTGVPGVAGAAAAGTPGVAAGATEGVPGASGALGFGTPAAAGALALTAGGTFGALCFCHASQSISAEKENTTKAMRRWVSIMGKADPSGNGVEAAVVPGMAAQESARGEEPALHGAVPLDRLDGIGR